MKASGKSLKTFYFIGHLAFFSENMPFFFEKELFCIIL